MKILGKKLKKVHIVKRFFYFLSLIIYIPSLIYFIIGLLKLSGIETGIRIGVIIFFAIWFAIYSLGGLISLLSKKTKTFVVLTIFTLLFCPVFIISSKYIHKVYGTMEMMNRNVITYTTNLVTLKNTEFSKNAKLGMIETEEDIEGNQLAKILIQKENITNKINYYEDYAEMIKDLYDGKIQGIFVSGNYAINFQNETFEDLPEGEVEVPFGERVKVVYSYSEDRENSDIVTLQESKTKELTEPFTILLMGVDSENDGLKANQAFNGDTLMLITFNPSTLTATMFSLPRDLYVPIACNNNRYAKINSSAAYGSTCVINTVQKLTGIKIDYYLKMNFKGVVDLVDSLGGITVDIEEPDFTYNAGINCGGKVCEQNSLRQFGKEMVYIDTGVQTINGEQALAYARCRHMYALSDIARNQHQQDIITAIAVKMKTVRSVTEFEDILNAISRNMETNLTPEQIMSFYNVGKDMLLNSNSNTFSIKKTYLSYYNLTVWRGYNASALGYHQASLDAIVDLMEVNLGLKEEKPIKTYSVSANEEYSTPLVGYGIAGGEKLYTLPNFFGYDKDYVDSWCTEHNLTCYFEKVNSTEEKGFILEQSEHENSLLKAISSVTFKYSSGQDEDEKSYTMPNYKGYAKSYVKTNFCDKYKMECEFEEVEGNKEKGEILSQSVKAGTTIKKGETIKFEISDGSNYTEEDNKDDDKEPSEKPETPTTPTTPTTPEPEEPETPTTPTTPSEENNEGEGSTKEEE